jgi:hypothetical protein
MFLHYPAETKAGTGTDQSGMGKLRWGIYSPKIQS